METLKIKNATCAALAQIPLAEDYASFRQTVRELLSSESCHCAHYFALPDETGLTLVMCIANDTDSTLELLGFKAVEMTYPSLAVTATDRFEREIAENHGIVFSGHKWPKPLRTTPDDYPFYRSDNEEHHEVGVGPIHAGVIEPGHFRFTCEGEMILNLEIMLGYQHRGVERLMLSKSMPEQRAMLAESAAGDTAVGSSIAFSSVIEALSGFQTDDYTKVCRTIACELERISIHTGDLSAICGDVAYQLGNAVYGRLRTPIINFMQKWCGNRLGKTCVRPFAMPYDLTEALREDLLATLGAYEKDFTQMSNKIRRFPSVLARLERTGTVSTEQAKEIGAVGMAARASGLQRDIRKSHPYLAYGPDFIPVVKHHGDVYARTQVRMEEIQSSISLIRSLLADMPCKSDISVPETYSLKPSSIAVSLVEGWRGELCHIAVTDASGGLSCYKIKDPSFHNWTALELAVRGNEISDFPICNKSFNLSYCGHDL